MSEAIIIVDIGNTDTIIGVSHNKCFSGVLRIPTKGQKSSSIATALQRVIRRYRIKDAALCSVVPALNKLWMKQLQHISGEKPLLINFSLKLGLGIDYPSPASIGPDRLANASAAAYMYGAPVIVADFGTALTFDVVSKQNTYIGGIIAPGLGLVTDYMAERTALLPEFSFKTYQARSSHGRKLTLPGKSTKEAMLLGGRYGYLGIVREIFTRLQKNLKATKLHLCATGGYASWVLSKTDIPVFIEPNLTLYGINRIYELNR